jgi:hypothetical protein
MQIKFSGGLALEKALKDLGASVAGRLGQNAVNAGARVIAADARSLAPVGKTGNLKRSIRVFTGRSTGGTLREACAVYPSVAREIFGVRHG